MLGRAAYVCTLAVAVAWAPEAEAEVPEPAPAPLRLEAGVNGAVVLEIDRRTLAYSIAVSGKPYFVSNGTGGEPGHLSRHFHRLD